jgi:hypothetical protein
MRFSYVADDDRSTSLMPRLMLTLEHGESRLDIAGLIDSGSTVNVLPYSVGLALGGVWDDQPTIPPLAGNLSDVEVRAFAASGWHSQLTPDEPVNLVFAWVRSENAPVIFGQINFFLEFDVCFYRSQHFFDITLKQATL